VGAAARAGLAGFSEVNMTPSRSGEHRLLGRIVLAAVPARSARAVVRGMAAVLARGARVATPRAAWTGRDGRGTRQHAGSR
jgi:hypothetical protein